MKILFRIALLFVLAVLLSQLAGGCMEFRMSPKEMEEFYEGEEMPSLVSFPYNDRTVHFAEIGDTLNPLVVFIHGSPGSWSAFASYLKDPVLRQQFHLISVDRPGFGYSNFGKAEPSLAKQSELLHQVLALYPYKKAILVGHSLGGPVAARMAMDYPKQVAGLLLIAPSIDPALEPEEWFRPLMRNFVVRTFVPKSFNVSNEEIIFLKEELEQMEPQWPSLQVPIYVLQGNADELVPYQNAWYPGKFLPDSLIHVEMLDGVNHFIPWSHPEEVKKGIFSLAAGS